MVRERLPVTYLKGLDITHVQEFTDILQNKWGPYAPENVAGFVKRIENARDGIVCGYLDGQPAIILETLLLPYTPLEMISDTFEELTGNNWNTYDENGVTRIAVDITVAASLEGRGLFGQLLRELIPEMRKQSTQGIYTYSPSIDSVIATHAKHGAIPHVREIKNARALHSMPDVTINYYTHIQ